MMLPVVVVVDVVRGLGDEDDGTSFVSAILPDLIRYCTSIIFVMMVSNSKYLFNQTTKRKCYKILIFG